MNKWIQQNGVLYNLNIKSNLPIAGFDLDGTLIEPKSGRKFPIDENDWKILDNKIIDIINNLSEYNIVIFTNQSGLDKKLGFDKFKIKINNIKQLFNQNISILIAYSDNFYRKPLTGMWDLLSEYQISKNNSFYVGDAAGRKNDHSDSDLNFAHNIGIKFITPELYISNISYDNFPIIKSNYIDIKKSLKIGKLKIKKELLELILLIGFPGSGKSSFAQKYYSSYEYINQDTEKSKDKIKIKVNNAIKNKKSIIIDNTNIDYTSRKIYIDMIKDTDYKIKIIIFDIPIKVCQHMMYYRTNINKTSSISIIVYRVLKKKCSINKDNEIEIKEENIKNDQITIYRINKIYIDNKEEYNKIINFRASITI
jgi:bifunctional polynucleotide phosphatase/kinase